MREMMIEQSRNIHALNLEVSQPHRFLNPASLGAEAKVTARTLVSYREHLKAKAKANIVAEKEKVRAKEKEKAMQPVRSPAANHQEQHHHLQPPTARNVNTGASVRELMTNGPQTLGWLKSLLKCLTKTD